MKIPLTELFISALLAGSAGGAPLPWWNNFPRMIITSDLATAQSYSANAAANGVANNPGWGLWFNYANGDGAADSSVRQNFQAAGIVSLSYNVGPHKNSAQAMLLTLRTF